MTPPSDEYSIAPTHPLFVGLRTLTPESIWYEVSSTVEPFAQCWPVVTQA